MIHEGQPVVWRGPAPAEARAVCVLLHGRGRSPEDVLGLAERIALDDVAFVAPAAAEHSWWPGSFLAPFAENEPWLSSALGAVDALVHTLGDLSRVVLGGFSQGACLAAEYALRHPSAFGGLLLYTGGFCGPAGTPAPQVGRLRGHARLSRDERSRRLGAGVAGARDRGGVLAARRGGAAGGLRGHGTHRQ